MKVEYDKIINKIIEDLIGYAYEDIINNDEEFREMEKKLCVHSKKMQDVLNHLDSRDRKVIEEYMEQVQCINGEYNNKIYVQGVKDCVKALKFFEVI